MRHGHPSPHVAVPWSVLLHRTAEVPSSNCGPEMSQPTDFMVFTQSLPANAKTNSNLARPIPSTLYEINLQQSPLTLCAVLPETVIVTSNDLCMVWGTLLLCAPLIPNLATTWWWSASPSRTPTGTR